jgi:AcrR family transcriptional regulator
LSAALAQLDESGYGSLSMESVACAAGVSRATIYRRFTDKADLITAAIAARPGFELPVAISTDPRADLIAYLDAFDQRFSQGCMEVLGGLLAQREEPHAMELHRARVISPRMDYARTLFVRAQELGVIDQEADIDLALEMLTGSVIARQVQGVKSVPGWAERAVNAIWRGMGPA